MTIDATTIYVTILLGNFFTVLLTGAYAVNHSDKRINLYILGKSTEFLGFTVALMRGILPPLFSVCAGNSLLIIGVSLETLAMLSIAGFDSVRLTKAFRAGTIAAVVLFDTASLLGANGAVRIALVSMTTVAAILVPTVTFLGHRKANLLERMVGLVYLFVVVGLTARSVEALSRGDAMDYLASTPMQSLAYLSLALNQVIGSVGFLLLAKEESDRDLKRAATRDSLTDLWNRRAFRDLAQSAISLCARKKESIAFATMDLDHFKEINDRYGHEAGDEILRLFARTASSALRPYDILARFGGEEFALLLPGITLESALAVTERVRSALESARLPLDSGEIGITVSIGLVVRPASESGTLDELYRAADAALYRAKEAGRNRVFSV